MKPDATIVRFGAFEADLHAGELRKNGLRVKLRDQPFEVLRILLERPGEILSREELRTRLWPTGTFVDFDHSLNACINKLREALGDTAANPRFIQTVPRRGYRFVAPTERPEPVRELEPLGPPEPPPQTQPQRARALSRPVLLIVAMTVVVAGVAIAMWLRSTSSRSHPFKPIPLTSFPGRELQPDFSPDGNHVVYSGGPGGLHNPDIYVKQIGSETVHRLAESPFPEIGPKWSPDGRSIAFVRVIGMSDSAESEVVVMPAFGGPARKVATISIPLSRTFGGQWFLDWFANSQTLVIADIDSQGVNLALFALDIRTQERWKLTAPPKGMGDIDPAVSPDGGGLAFTRLGANRWSIYLLRLDARHHSLGEPRLRTSGSVSLNPVWTPDGRELLFASGPQHWKRLFRIRVDGQTAPEQVSLAVEGGQPSCPAISAKWQLAYPVQSAQTDIYRANLARNRSDAARGPFLSSTFLDHLPEYSPDGKRVAFISDRSGSQQIWISDSEGVNSHQLTFIPEDKEARGVRWSPDSRRLLFISGDGIYSIGAEGGPPTLQIKDPAVSGHAAEWSRDGKWIFFASNRTGRPEIWKAPDASANRADAVQVTRNGGWVPRLGVDGEFIYYAKGHIPSEVWKVPVNGGTEIRVVERVLHNGAFTVNGEGVYFIPLHEIPAQEGTAHDRIYFLDFRTGVRTVVTTLGGHPMWGLTISPDKRFLLASHWRGEGEADLMLVDRFR